MTISSSPNLLLVEICELKRLHPEWSLDLTLCHNNIKEASQGIRRDVREAIVIAAIATGAQTIDDIASDTNLPRTTVFRLLRRLEETQAIEFRKGLYHRVYSLPL